MEKDNEINMKKDHECLGYFDREYVFSDLVPASYFNFLSRALTHFGLGYFAVVSSNGSCDFSSDPARADALPDKELMDSIFAENSPCPRAFDNGLWLVPISHELEIVALIVAEAGIECKMNKDIMEHFLLFVRDNIEQIIGCNYKNLLTSGLHTQVVEDSYYEIRKKTEMIEESEKKYRQLAENLEIEVNRKTQEIKETQSQLMHQEKLASIGHLAAGVAHEINNPMGFITSNLRTLNDYTKELTEIIHEYQSFIEDLKNRDSLTAADAEAADELDRLVKYIEKSDIGYLLSDAPVLLRESLEGAERINKIVSDLKDFAHPGEETPAYADLIHCIESTLNIVWNELKYKTTVIKSFSRIPQVYCYPRQLNQVIMNLLVNSAQAIEKKGEIEITTTDLGDNVAISIRDTGQGIPEENLQRIFDPFFTTKDVGKGTGLGLNLVYNIVKKHKGMIDVKSEVGKGTEFIITLPVNPDL